MQSFCGFKKWCVNWMALCLTVSCTNNKAVDKFSQRTSPQGSDLKRTDTKLDFDSLAIAKEKDEYVGRAAGTNCLIAIEPDEGFSYLIWLDRTFLEAWGPNGSQPGPGKLEASEFARVRVLVEKIPAEGLNKRSFTNEVRIVTFPEGTPASRTFSRNALPSEVLEVLRSINARLFINPPHIEPRLIIPDGVGSFESPFRVTPDGKFIYSFSGPILHVRDVHFPHELRKSITYSDIRWPDRPSQDYLEFKHLRFDEGGLYAVGDSSTGWLVYDQQTMNLLGIARYEHYITELNYIRKPIYISDSKIARLNTYNGASLTVPAAELIKDDAPLSYSGQTAADDLKPDQTWSVLETPAQEIVLKNKVSGTSNILAVHQRLICAAESPNHQFLATAMLPLAGNNFRRSYLLQIRRMSDGAIVLSLHPREMDCTEEITQIAWTPDGKRICASLMPSADSPWAVGVWNCSSGRYCNELDCGMGQSGLSGLPPRLTGLIAGPENSVEAKGFDGSIYCWQLPEEQ